MFSSLNRQMVFMHLILIFSISYVVPQRHIGLCHISVPVIVVLFPRPAGIRLTTISLMIFIVHWPL
jgi:hypothetical protein